MKLSINLDCIKAAGKHNGNVLLYVDFGLEDRFCDAQKLRESWSNTQIPDVLLAFFTSLFNINRTILMKEIFKEGNTTPFDKEEGDYSENSSDQHKRVNLRMNSLFQILYNQVFQGRKNTPLHILNAHVVYEHCQSRELITAFNRQCCSVSFKTMKTMRSDIAKHTILKSKDDNLPLPGHFRASSFTIAACDNFDNTGRNTLSGTKHAHDTATTIFQGKPQNPISKPKRALLNRKVSINFRSSNVKNLPFSTQRIQNFPYQNHLT